MSKQKHGGESKRAYNFDAAFVLYSETCCFKERGILFCRGTFIESDYKTSEIQLHINVRISQGNIKINEAVREKTILIPTWSDTNQSTQSQTQARIF